MKDKIYLIIDRKGVCGYRKGHPNLHRGEFAVRLSVEISDKFFEHTIPDANLVVPDDHVLQPNIDVQLLEKLGK